MTRIPLPTRDSLPADLQGRWDRMAARGPILNIYRVFLANPAIQLNAQAVWAASGLSDRAREIVILRCAHQKQSTYEWHQHVRIARSVGLSDQDIDAIRAWPKSDRFSADERALLAYFYALAAEGNAGDQVFGAMAASRSPGEVVGVTFLVTLYFQLAAIMATLQLETEAPFVGWDLSKG